MANKRQREKAAKKLVKTVGKGARRAGGMILLSAEVHSRFLNLASDLAEFDEFCRQHERRFVFEFVPAVDGDVALSLEEKVTTLLYSALARARMLAWTIAQCINSDLAVGAFLATRAHYEMAGLLAYALREIRAWRSGEASRGACEDKIVQLILGRRVVLGDDDSVPPTVYAVNALTMLTAVDSVLENKGLKGEFKASYEWLSEFCHPNSFAHMITGRQREGRRLVFERQPTFSHIELSTVIVHANSTFQVFLDTWDLLHSAIQPNQSGSDNGGD
jgi:hypothetical protein